MTDKQIIIDGVDVSGCEWYKQGATGMICADYNKSNDCSKNPNCSYKNWQRKEQECEGLKEKVKKYGEINEQETKDYAELKTENDELKDLNTRLDNQRETYWKGYQKLKQTLTEIKEIIHFNKTNRLSGGADISIEQILQKISECEGNNDMENN